MRSLVLLSLFITAASLTACTKHEVDVKPIETTHNIKVEPIHITIDVNIKVDRQLDKFFAFEDDIEEEVSTKATPPNSQ